MEELFCEVKNDIRKKLCFDIELPIRKNYFALSKMSEMCETTIPKLQMDLALSFFLIPDDAVDRRKVGF